MQKQTGESPVRQLYLALFTAFASVPAMALTFQTRMENVEWKVDGDQFECRLTQAVNGFGTGSFVRRAGEQATFRLSSEGGMLNGGSATLLSAAAPWQPGRADISLGAVRLGSGDNLLNSSQGQASRLLNGLLEGRSVVVRSSVGEGSRGTDVRVLPINFPKAYSDFQLCAGKMLAMNFDQVRESQIPFPKGIELDAAGKKRLDTILAFMKADPTVNHIEIDGHSDNSSNRLNNRDLSRRRALAVFDYFKAAGVPEEHMVMRFHGEQFPLVPNNTPANRARNRRVNIELDRVTGEQKAAPAPFVLPTMPPPSAPGTAPAAAAGKLPAPASIPAATPAPAPAAKPAAAPSPAPTPAKP
jgi:outer membrane protein OmpA-like peptidoglycan-associated protein